MKDRKVAPLPWVKSWTSTFTDLDWLSLPLEVRGVFQELVKLGGTSFPRGEIRGTDEQIASALRAPTKNVSRAIDLLAKAPHYSVKRVAKGVRIVNWGRYQTPANYEPALSYGRKPAESTPNARRALEGEGEEVKRETPRWLAAALGELATVENYPFEIGTDGPHLEKLADDFPTVDPIAAVRAWVTYKLDKPIMPGQSPRAQLRTWFTKSVEWGRDLKVQGIHEETADEIRARFAAVGS